MMLTYFRLALIIPFTACFYLPDAWHPWSMSLAFWLFVIASITDFLDGYVARARGEVSALGAALDPIADKLLLATALIMLVKTGTLSGIGVAGAVLMVAREILVSGLREAVAPHGITLPVTVIAKIKTSVQLVAIGAMLLSVPGTTVASLPSLLVAILFWTALALTMITGADYSWRAVQALRTKG